MSQKLVTSLRKHSEKFPIESESCNKTITLIEHHWIWAFENENWEGHITASMLIMNHERTKVLLMFHKKFQKWLQFWGHSDWFSDTFATAVREFHEESWIEVEPVCNGIPFIVDVHDIAPDAKWRPQHNHHDILYLGFIDENTPFSRQESEVDDIRWFDIDSIFDVLWSEVEILSRITKIQSLG